MFGLPIAFATPWLLAALLSLPVIWWLLRLTPPRPQQEVFPPTRILSRLARNEDTPAQSPWWLTLLRLLIAALAIIAMAGPVLNPQETALEGDGPLMVIIDDGWASANDWENRRDTALALIEEAEASGRSVVIQGTTNQPSWPMTLMDPQEARNILRAAKPMPLFPAHGDAARRFNAFLETGEVGEVAFLSDGLEHTDTASLSSSLEARNLPLKLYIGSSTDPVAMEPALNEPTELRGSVVRADVGTAVSVNILAKDKEGLTIARTTAVFGASEKRAGFSFTEPVELRNQITRLEPETGRNAASVQLLDDSNRRRLVGLLSGAAFDQSQPLLSPLYYISRALGPFSDVRRASDANLVSAVPDLINQGVSAIVLADVGNLQTDVSDTLEAWVENGGMLIRFAGPRLGASAESERLLPVDIRPGDRQLGGALSWDTPKPLAPFDPGSPFFGIEAPRDVLVEKQLLPLQEARLEEKTWAVLEDGTPLVTADKIGAGWVVLFHVSSDTEWSNLPLSGTFVEMLRRTVNLARSGPVTDGEGGDTVLPPLRLLDAQGAFEEPAATAKPLVKRTGESVEASIDNPPGLYGTQDGMEALNLIEETTELNRLVPGNFFANAQSRAYISGKQEDLTAWLLLMAAVLFILDCLAVLWMSGSLKQMRGATARTASLLAIAAMVSLSSGLTNKAQAQNADFDYSAALETRLAYALTGIDEVDRISRAGMQGLTLFLRSRTALEPGEPIGLDLERDELSFYSLIYWPVDPSAPLPTPETMARIDAYMKQGGSVLFDTRDRLSGALGGTANSPAAIALQQMLSALDIPALEPVPSDHVLTKSFYLLDEFPGRFSGGDLWVQVSEEQEENEGRPARVGDGVSSIMITSNDLAGAWAVDASLQPLLPTVPSDPLQRNYAYRVGVNLMMYTLTGNYKSDQVHLPELLERLGQ